MEINREDVILESSLLKAMSVRKNLETFIDYIDVKRLLSNTALLLKDYKKYFDSFEHDMIDWGVFTTQFSHQWHAKDMDEDDISYYRDTVIPLISKASDADVNNVLIGLLDRDYLTRVSNITNNGMDVTLLQDLLIEYTQQKEKYQKSVDSEAFSIDKVDFEILDKEKGIPWFLPTLQQGLGSLVQGQFVVVSADYGAGKSAFVISQAVEAFKHLHRTNDKRPILYFNSEGTQADVFGRFLSALYSKHVHGGFEEILKRIGEIKEKFISTFTANNFLVFQIGHGDIAKIRQKVDAYKPSMVVIDIADVLAPEEDVQHLKKLYDGLRLLSAQSCPIIATTQAGNTSYQYFDKENQEMKVKSRKWLTDKDLYGSKAGKGGAASEIITIGKDDDMPNIRYVSVSKKKRGQAVNTTCELIEKFSIYKEIF